MNTPLEIVKQQLTDRKRELAHIDAQLAQLRADQKYDDIYPLVVKSTHVVVAIQELELLVAKLSNH